MEDNLMEIIYTTLTDDIEKKLFEKCNWIYKYNCIPKYDRCYNIVAIHENEPIGCATLGPKKWTPLLDMYEDVLIHWIFWIMPCVQQ
jgi:hypothetical protein